MVYHLTRKLNFCQESSAQSEEPFVLVLEQLVRVNGAWYGEIVCDCIIEHARDRLIKKGAYAGNLRLFWSLHSTPWISHSRYSIPEFFVSGTWITDSNR